MTCNKFAEEDFSLYLNEEMTSPKLEEFEAHVEKCTTCAANLYRASTGRPLTW